MVNTSRVNADRGQDFHPLADHMTKSSAFPVSLPLLINNV